MLGPVEVQGRHYGQTEEESGEVETQDEPGVREPRQRQMHRIHEQTEQNWQDGSHNNR